MTDRTAKRIADLQQQYEDACAAAAANPGDSKAHARTITAAEKLQQARQADRERQTADGTRPAGMGVVAESNGRG